MIIEQTSLDMAHKIYNSIKSTIFKFSYQVYNVYDIFKYNKVIKQKNQINDDDDVY